MSQVKAHPSWIVIIVLCLSSLCFAQEPRQAARPATATQSDDEATLRALTEKYFAAYAKKDLDQMTSIWTPLSAQFEPTKKKLRELFAANAQIEVRNLMVRKIAVDSNLEQASVRVEFEMSAVDAKTGAPAAGFGKMRRTLIFSTRDKGAWWIMREVASEIEDFAAALVATKTEDERKALLAAKKELQPAELREALVAQGDKLREQGYSQEDYQRALTSYGLAQTIAEQAGDKDGIARALTSIGKTYLYWLYKYDLALEAYQKALTLYEALGDKRAIARALYYLGSAHYELSHNDLALEYYQKALALRGAFRNEAADQEFLGGLMYDIAWVYNEQGKSDIALEHYRLALEHFQKALAMYEAVGDKRSMGGILRSIGFVHGLGLRDRDLAQESFQKSLLLLESSGSKNELANTLGGASFFHLTHGNFARALEYRQKILAMYEALGDKPRIPLLLVNVGIVHYMQGSYDLAMEYYQKALRLAVENKRAAENKEGAKWTIAAVLERIGRTHGMMGNYDLALENSHKAVAEYKASGYEWAKSAIAFIFTDIGYVHLKRGEYDLALKYYQQALTDDQGGNPWGKARALNGIAEIYLRRGDYAQALESASRSAAVFKQGVFRGNALYGLLDSRTIAGRAYQRLNRPAEARQAFDEAIALVEGLRTQVVGGEQERQRFFEGSISPYHAMVEFLLAQKDAGEALAYAERAKARALLDVLQSGRVNITKTMTPQEQEQERKLISEMVSLNTQISQERMRPQPNQARLDDLNARLKKARLEYETFQVKLYVAHPELKVQRGEAQPLKLEEAASLLPDTKSALLEYVVTDERTYLFVLTKNEQGKVDLKTYTVEIKNKELAERTQAFRQQLAKRNLVFRSSASALYDLLLKPASAQLQGKTALVIVPDGALWELPFQALQPAENRYLIEDYAISYAPSLTVLREMIKLRRKETASTTTAPKLLALGNPALKSETVARVKSVFRDEKLDPLPEAEREVKALRQLYGAARSTIYIGADAREDRVKAEAGRFRILHLATHGILNDASPMYSQVLLSQAAGNASEDGLLEAWEIMKLDLNADLVVLSACETARGRVGAGEGMIGLTWALFVAGSPTTVVSQWKVESASTTELIVEFHRQLQAQMRNSDEPVSTARALRAAALKLLRSDEYRHPFHWAGFVVVGDGR